jgi:hypothetical protein
VKLAGALLVWAASGQAQAEETMRSSLLAPGLTRGMTRVHGTLRPFVSLVGHGGGAIADVAVERYFHITPTAFAVQPASRGAVTHLRGEAAFATDFLEVGASAGSRLENFGPGGSRSPRA